MTKSTDFTREDLAMLRKICDHARHRSYSGAPELGSAFEVKLHGQMLGIHCDICNQKWTGVPVDLWIGEDTGAWKQVMADALAEGRFDAAITIFVEFNFQHIKKRVEALKEE